MDDEAVWERVAIRLEMVRRFLDGGHIADAQAEVMILTGIVGNRRPVPELPEVRQLHPAPVDLDEVRPGDVAERELPCPICKRMVKVRVDGSLRVHADCEPPEVRAAARRRRFTPDDDALTREQIMEARG